MVHRPEVGMDRIGQAPPLAHLPSEPRAEAAPTEDVVHHVGRVVVRVVPFEALVAENDDALGDVALHHHRLSRR
jgi:hypothetical protein